MRTFKPFETSPDWEFIDPDTHYRYKADSREDLVRRIVQYRSQNGLPTLDRLDLVLEDYLCSLPANCGKCKDTPLQRGLLTYIKGGISLIKNLWYGEESLVDQELADSRAEICLSCPLNEFPDKGPFIMWTDDIAMHSVGDRKSKHHDKLGNCAACTCVLKAKVFYKGPFSLLASEKSKMEKADPKCWQLGEK